MGFAPVTLGHTGGQCQLLVTAPVVAAGTARPHAYLPTWTVTSPLHPAVPKSMAHRRCLAGSQGQAPPSIMLDWSAMCVQITWEDLAAAEQAVGTFGGDNRAGVQGTLHRISAIRNRKGTIVGLTCRVGRAVTGHIDMIRDMLEGGLAYS